MAPRQVTGVPCRNPSAIGATTAQAPATALASISARSRRLPCRSESTDEVAVWTMVPARPRTAAPAMVVITASVVVNSAAPPMAPSADHHSTERRPTRRQARAKVNPTTAAPAAHSAE